MNETFKRLFSGKEADKGFEEEELKSVENRLEIKLPKVLRQFYKSQVKNVLINSCHYFANLQNLYLYQSDWLVFYGENQGICFWAIHKEDFEKDTFKVYVNYEEQGFEVEAKNFNDFLIIRAASDYSKYIYSFSATIFDATKKDLEIIMKKLGPPNSAIHPKNYSNQKLFWEDENEVVKIIEWNQAQYNNRTSINIVSKKEDCINNYKALIKAGTWKISKSTLWNSENLTSYLEDRTSTQITNNTNKELDSKRMEAKKDDLPF